MLEQELHILGQTIDVFTVGTWAAAGLLIGLLFVVGQRPMGLIGDIILGIFGGFLFGFLGVILKFDFADYMPASTGEYAPRIASFLAALLGGLTLLVLIRLIKRN
jgi:uncharacterized membrane protein YeaQ/YmgE (transglycosylase-associated protein family)